MNWHNTNSIRSREFTCGFCGNIVASASGFFSQKSFIYICPHCQAPTFFEDARQVPGVAPGADVAHLPADIGTLYREARNCVSIGSHTSAVLTCRKLLMNIAVSQKAPENKPFIFYVSFLADQGYVPPNGRAWVDHIRTKGNEANHEIRLMTEADAEELISFSEMLLKFIYEFPNRIPQTTTSVPIPPTPGA
jgi:hypothetical protein